MTMIDSIPEPPTGSGGVDTPATVLDNVLHELAAMQTCLKALEELDPAARRRAMVWLDSRLSTAIGFPQAAQPMVAPAPQFPAGFNPFGGP